jgi:DNA gyrase/topoisomerase IV subunit B
MLSICEGLTCKYEVQRNKGLGEMNSDELKDSTMDKDTRKLIQVTIDDIIEAEKALSVCMYDKDVANRKHFILANKPEGELDEE